MLTVGVSMLFILLNLAIISSSVIPRSLAFLFWDSVNVSGKLKAVPIIHTKVSQIRVICCNLEAMTH